mmetsp:Transcript_10039/g.33144  ORF Transcript_10039/g.33144 Transcript_10039/m.33144 type:complete len:344 (-) Transcript_10039:201-1232(-)
MISPARQQRPARRRRRHGRRRRHLESRMFQRVPNDLHSHRNRFRCQRFVEVAPQHIDARGHAAAPDERRCRGAPGGELAEELDECEDHLPLRVLDRARRRRKHQRPAHRSRPLRPPAGRRRRRLLHGRRAALQTPLRVRHAAPRRRPRRAFLFVRRVGVDGGLDGGAEAVRRAVVVLSHEHRQPRGELGDRAGHDVGLEQQRPRQLAARAGVRRVRRDGFAVAGGDTAQRARGLYGNPRRLGAQQLAERAQHALGGGQARRKQLLVGLFPEAELTTEADDFAERGLAVGVGAGGDAGVDAIDEVGNERQLAQRETRGAGRDDAFQQRVLPRLEARRLGVGEEG